MSRLEAGVRRVMPVVGGHAAHPGAPVSFDAFEFHRDHVVRLPFGCVTTHRSFACRIEGFRHLQLPVEGVQVHPEIGPERAVAILEAWSAEAPEGVEVVGNPSRFDPKPGFEVVMGMARELRGARAS